MTLKPSKPFGQERRVSVQAKYIAMLAPFVSTDVCRFYLNAIYIAPLDEGVVMVATDGHRMGIVRDKTGTADKPWICPVPRLIAAACMPKRNKGKDNAPQLCHFVGSVAYVTNRVWEGANPDIIGENHLAIAASSAIDGTYPQWQKVVPKETELDRKGKELLPLIPFNFNAAYLATYQTVAKAAGVDKAMVSIVVRDKASPALVFVSGIPEFIGIILPVRIDVPADLPEWLKLDGQK